MGFEKRDWRVLLSRSRCSGRSRRPPRERMQISILFFRWQFCFSGCPREQKQFLRHNVFDQFPAVSDRAGRASDLCVRRTESASRLSFRRGRGADRRLGRFIVHDPQALDAVTALLAGFRIRVFWSPDARIRRSCFAVFEARHRLAGHRDAAGYFRGRDRGEHGTSEGFERFKTARLYL